MFASQHANKPNDRLAFSYHVLAYINSGGVARTLCVLVPEWLDTFQGGVSETALIASSITGLFLGCGKSLHEASIEILTMPTHLIAVSTTSVCHFTQYLPLQL